MFAVSIDAPRRYRKWIKKSQLVTVREATECLKEVEEEAQAMERTDLITYSIYDGDQLVFRDEIPIGAGQSSNLLFLVQKALSTDLFSDEPQENKNRLLAQLAQEIRSHEPLPAALQKPRKQSRISLSFVLEKGKKKAPSDQKLNTDGAASLHETKRNRKEPNQVRGDPPSSFLQTFWESTQTACDVCKTGLKKGFDYYRAWQRKRLKMSVLREKRKLKALDVRQEEAKLEQRLMIKLENDRRKMKKQVEAEARKQERLASELKKARAHRSGPKISLWKWVGLVGLLIGLYYLWKNPAIYHRLVDQATLVWHQIRTGLNFL